LEISTYQGTAGEAEGMIGLLKSIFVVEGYTDPIEAEKWLVPDLLQKRGIILVAKKDGGETLGMVICVSPTSPLKKMAEKDEAEVHLLAVSPAARCQGLGSRLMEACEQRAVLLGYFNMVLWTQPSMKAAQRLYEGLGYQRNPGRDWTQGPKSYWVYEKKMKGEV